MLKKVLLIAVICTLRAVTYAQTADEVYDKYIDFNLALLQSEHDRAMTLGEQILPDSAKLPQKVRTSFYNGIAKLYEDDSQSIKAITYYSRVAAAQPNYYVAHRALGYLYIKDVVLKLDSQSIVNAVYIAKVKKALPHLEKAQACDPSDDTIALIKLLYRNIKDERGLDTLGARLSELRKNCVDILSSE